MFGSRLPWWSALPALALVACTGSIVFRSPVTYDIDLGAYASRYAQVEGLVVGSQIDEVPCSGANADASCQALVPTSGSGSDVVMRCDAGGRCDPDPFPLVQVLGVQDFSELASTKVSVLDRLELVRIELTVDRNTSNLDVPPIEIRWGTESASAAALDATTQRLATIPLLAAGSTGEVDVTLDEAGLAALTEYLHGTSQRVSFFLRSNVDVEPGQPIPSGALGVTVGFVIRASGQLR